MRVYKAMDQRKWAFRLLRFSLLLFVCAAFAFTGRGIWVLLNEESSIKKIRVELICDGSQIESQYFEPILENVSSLQELVTGLEAELGLIVDVKKQQSDTPLLYCRYQQPFVYCLKDRTFGFTRDGKLVYVDPLKRSQDLPSLILPMNTDDVLLKRLAKDLLPQLFFEMEQLEQMAPNWKVDCLDLGQYEGKGVLIDRAGIDGGSYFGDIILRLSWDLSLQPPLGEELHMDPGTPTKKIRMFFRMGYGSCVENLQQLRANIRFREVFSDIHPIWKNHEIMLFDLRFAKAIYYKAL